MISPARLRPNRRISTDSNKPAQAQRKTFSAPTLGLVTNTPLTSNLPGACVELENFWPTAEGIEVRGGSIWRVSVPGSVQSIFEYRGASTEEFFVSDEDAVYSFNGATPPKTLLTNPVILEQSNGKYSSVETTTAGGAFLTIVNGEDFAQQYNGTTWSTLDIDGGTASVPDPEWLGSDYLSYVWAYRSRQFFIQKGSMNVWYLGINEVSGDATKFPLSAQFNNGGSLLFGATWSSDSGDGLDDRCVFVTDTGEVAIYAGDNPSDLNSWGLVGVYEIGTPLGAGAYFKVGGDIVLATTQGLVPLSAAIQKDTSQLKLDSLSRNIEGDWVDEVNNTAQGEDWLLCKSDSKDMAIVSPSSAKDYCYAINTSTNRWTKFTGWYILALGTLSSDIYFGDASGKVYITDSGGMDGELGFDAKACFWFDDMGSPGAFKIVQTARSTWFYNGEINPQISIAVDYKSNFNAPPSGAQAETSDNIARWDHSKWDVALWAGDSTERSYTVSNDLVSVSGSGYALAPQIQITSISAEKLKGRLGSIDITFIQGM